VIDIYRTAVSSAHRKKYANFDQKYAKLGIFCLSDGEDDFRFLVTFWHIEYAISGIFFVGLKGHIIF
jgi:hypothetical protein